MANFLFVFGKYSNRKLACQNPIRYSSPTLKSFEKVKRLCTQYKVNVLKNEVTPGCIKPQIENARVISIVSFIDESRICKDFKKHVFSVRYHVFYTIT